MNSLSTCKETVSCDALDWLLGQPIGFGPRMNCSQLSQALTSQISKKPNTHWPNSTQAHKKARWGSLQDKRKTKEGEEKKSSDESAGACLAVQVGKEAPPKASRVSKRQSRARKEGALVRKVKCRSGRWGWCMSDGRYWWWNKKHQQATEGNWRRTKWGWLKVTTATW